MSKTWKITGIHFAHMHMGDLLRQVHEHPRAEIAGIFHPEASRMRSSVENFQIPPERVHTDLEACLHHARPDIAILCPSTGEHADWTEKVASFDCHILVEKPFAASLADADRMIAALDRTGRQLAINWPLRWYPPHVTTKRLIDEGRIGDILEVHYYDGNRGPLRHTADKIETDPGSKSESWWYQKKHGGGSLLDYLGYGVTLATWFRNGEAPVELVSMVDRPAGLEVDEHSITVARYASGLSKFETRWGAFTDPWTHQPQPKCGFIVVGTAGTISSYDYESSIRLQTREHPAGRDLPVDTLEAPFRNPVEYFIHCLETDNPVAGPLSPAICRIGQQMVDTACQSAQSGHTLPLLDR